MQADLFNTEQYPEPDVVYRPNWLPPDQAGRLEATCRRELPWRQEQIRLFGRWVWQPRLQVWMGDPEATYRYSGQDFVPEPWHPVLLDIARRLSDALQTPFNAVLCNAYEHGRHSMGWHSDNEPELGPDPVVASVSLGAPRRFLLRLKTDKHVRHEWPLGHGDLLVMQGDTQTYWEHGIPKTTLEVGPRLNLTFRHIGSPVA